MLAFGLVISFTGLDPLISFGVAAVVGVLSTVYHNSQKDAVALTSCGTIARSNKKNCDDLPGKGTRDRMVVFDLENATFTYDVTGNITNIVLASGTFAYEFDGSNNSIKPMAEMIEGTLIDKFDHAVDFIGLDVSQAAKTDAEKMRGGFYVAICENYVRGTNGTKAFEVYAPTVGMELVTLKRDPNSADSEGGLEFRLYTRTNKENTLQKFLFNTDYATTKAIVDGLVAP